MFKFNLTKEDYQKKLGGSLQEGETGDDRVRFDVLRQLFLDRDL